MSPRRSRRSTSYGVFINMNRLTRSQFNEYIHENRLNIKPGKFDYMMDIYIRSIAHKVCVSGVSADCVRAKNINIGYWVFPSITRVKKVDGWIDTDGFLYVPESDWHPFA